MDFLDNYKQYFIIIIITVILGYFLGITVSTVVDYRLKEAVVNLPRPKNNITVQVKDKKLNSEIIRTRKRNYKKNVENFKSNTNKTNKKNKKSKKNKTIEKFQSSINNNSNLIDPNMNAYANNFNNSQKNASNTIPYKAFNEEYANDNYLAINNDNYENPPDKKIKISKKISKKN